MKGTGSRSRLLRYLSLLVVSVSGLAASFAIITLLVSFIRPEWGAIGLYKISGIVFRVGFASIFAAIGIGAASSYLLRSKGELSSGFEKQFGRYSAVLKAVAAIAALVMAVTLIQGFKFVKLSSGKWISTIRAGSREIS